MRYIDADKLIFQLRQNQMWTKSRDLTEAIITVQNQPTADVVEVKHGYWKDRYGNKYDNHLYECSVCGKEALCEIYSNELQQTKTRQVLSNGCPHCLAKMDGGDKL